MEATGKNRSSAPTFIIFIFCLQILEQAFAHHKIMHDLKLRKKIHVPENSQPYPFEKNNDPSPYAINITSSCTTCF